MDKEAHHREEGDDRNDDIEKSHLTTFDLQEVDDKTTNHYASSTCRDCCGEG